MNVRRLLSALAPLVAFVLAAIHSPQPATTATGMATNTALGAPSYLEADDDQYVCPPCGEACHHLTFDAPGNCSMCGMALVPRSDVINVAVLLFESADVLGTAGPLAVFGNARTNVYTVADTTDPITLQHGLTIVPQFDLENAPAPDVLIVPSSYGAVWEDEYVTDWVNKTAETADHVLGVGFGILTLVSAGLVEDGATLVGPTYLASRSAEFAPGIVFEQDEAFSRLGSIVSARDAVGAMEASFEILSELEHDEGAARSAERLGFGQ